MPQGESVFDNTIKSPSIEERDLGRGVTNTSPQPLSPEGTTMWREGRRFWLYQHIDHISKAKYYRIENLLLKLSDFHYNFC